MKFLVFAASHRNDSFNRKLVEIAATHLSARGDTVDHAQYHELDLPLYNDESASAILPAEVDMIGRRFAKADGVVISSPEYNWSYPGSLKNLVDWLSRLSPLPTNGRTVFLMSASTSMRGGILGLSHLETPLRAIQMIPFPRVFLLASATEAFASESRLADSGKQETLRAMLDEYRTFTQKLTQ